jgi:hypothetical protein
MTEIPVTLTVNGARVNGAYNIKAKSNKYGFATLDWEMDREISVGYDDIGLNLPVQALTDAGDIIWEGLIGIREIEVYPAHGLSHIRITAVGSINAINAKLFGSIPAGSPESQINWLYSNGYMNQMASVTLATTGLSASVVSGSDNKGTDDTDVIKIIKDICAQGDSSGNLVLPQVWDNRKFYTTVLSKTPSRTYYLRTNQIDKIKILTNSDSVYTQVISRYTNSLGQLARDIQNNTSQQQALKYAANWVRPLVQDKTSGRVFNSSTEVVAWGTTTLNDKSVVRNTSAGIELSRDFAVSRTGSDDLLRWECLRVAGSWLYMPDLSSIISGTGGTGNTNADATYITDVLIQEVELDFKSGVVTLIPDQSNSLAEV